MEIHPYDISAVLRNLDNKAKLKKNDKTRVRKMHERIYTGSIISNLWHVFIIRSVLRDMDPSNV